MAGATCSASSACAVAGVGTYRFRVRCVRRSSSRVGSICGIAPEPPPKNVSCCCLMFCLCFCVPTLGISQDRYFKLFSIFRKIIFRVVYKYRVRTEYLVFHFDAPGKGWKSGDRSCDIVCLENYLRKLLFYVPGI